MHILHIIYLFKLAYIAYNTHPVLFFWFLRRCVELFPKRIKRGDLLVATEDVHSIKHAPNDIIRWADPENMSREGPETNHKKWVKGQGGKTHQSDTSNKTVMNHSLQKEASASCSR